MGCAPGVRNNLAETHAASSENDNEHSKFLSGCEDERRYMESSSYRNLKKQVLFSRASPQRVQEKQSILVEGMRTIGWKSDERAPRNTVGEAHFRTLKNTG